MQRVSQNWKKNQNSTLVGESNIEISLKISDPDAHRNATVTDNGHPYFSNTSRIVSDGDDTILPYATLEPNQWVLDGTRDILPNSGIGDTGYVGDALCDANGLYSNNPVVTVKFGKVITNVAHGITIRWSDFLSEYAVDFVVKVFNGETVIAERTIIGNDQVLFSMEFDIVNYDGLMVEIRKWSMPYRRARIDELLVGSVMVFTKDSVFSYDYSASVDPISAELTKSDISFSIDNLDNAFNPYNTEGISKYLLERQEVDVRYGYKMSTGYEWIKGGKFYLSEWNAEQNGMSADFTARDLLEFMTDTYYKGTYYAEGISLYDLAEDVFQDVSMLVNPDGSQRWVIDECLKDIYTIAPLPIDTHANCLQMIANAGGCVFYQDRRGVLRLESVPNLFDTEDISTDYDISHFNSYSKSSLSLSKPLKQVDVACYGYSVAELRTEIHNGTMNINGTTDVTITYSGLATNPEATVKNGTLNSAKYYSNACILNITAEGTVTIKVRGYVLEASSLNITIPSDVAGEIVSVDNQLITSHERALAVGTWIEKYMRNRQTLSSDWRADPRLDALDVVDIENDYAIQKVLMSSVQYNYNGAFRGSSEGRVI